MVSRIEVALKSGLRDARGDRVKRDLARHFAIDVRGVRTLDVYTLDAEFSAEELERIAHGPLCDPVIQDVAINRPLAKDFDVLMEVGFLPGVTDNVGRTAREAIAELLGRPLAAGEGVYTSVQYLFEGELSDEEKRLIAEGYLANALIQRCRILSRAEFDAAGGVAPLVPKVMVSALPQAQV
ncbi:MAG: phosphoribosylformylglycinamidine synthase subunit PurS, partial [Deltaproteobacteria bacterium]|nr:phosphoribosylformylglycinamidine synthase subunit PurS [Deltaproteobacteria bacterium]